MHNLIETLIKDLRLTFSHEMDGRQIYKGGGVYSDIFPSPEWKEERSWALDGIRHVTVNKKLMATLCYCEGDLILCVAPTRKSFKAAIKAAEEFYRIN